MALERLIEDSLTGVAHGFGATGLDHPRGHQADAAVAVFVVIPLEEAQAEGAGILDRAEPLRERRMVFHGLELAFRERVVIGLVGPGMALADAQVGQKERRRFRGHGGAPVGVDGQGSLADAVAGASFFDR